MKFLMTWTLQVTSGLAHYTTAGFTEYILLTCLQASVDFQHQTGKIHHCTISVAIFTSVGEFTALESPWNWKIAARLPWPPWYLNYQRKRNSESDGIKLSWEWVLCFHKGTIVSSTPRESTGASFSLEHCSILPTLWFSRLVWVIFIMEQKEW